MIAQGIFDENPDLSLPLESDVDIGVKPGWRKKLTVKEKVELAQALEDLFLVPRADLVALPKADPFLAVNVIRGERLYARDDHLRQGYNETSGVNLRDSVPACGCPHADRCGVRPHVST